MGSAIILSDRYVCRANANREKKKNKKRIEINKGVKGDSLTENCVLCVCRKRLNIFAKIELNVSNKEKLRKR